MSSSTKKPVPFAGNTRPLVGSIASGPGRLGNTLRTKKRTHWGPGGKPGATDRVVFDAPDATIPKPSEFLATSQMTTEGYLAANKVARPPRIVEFMDVGEFSTHKDTGVSIDLPLFQPFPSEIRFQKFAPQGTYDIPLVLRNIDKVGRRIKVLPSESAYFTLIPQENQAGKVAPGMELVYIVRFTPDEYKDYADEIVCITEREKFVIPVRAVGGRAILDFPDKVTFATCPVKFPSTKVLLVRNVGQRAASFSVQATAPFVISPPTGQLEVGTCTQIEAKFSPQTVGSHSGRAQVHYDTGETVEFELYGAAEDANVRIDKGSITMESTFIGQSSQRTLKIQNRSDVVAHFDWRAAATAIEEEQERDRLAVQLDDDEDREFDDFDRLMETDPTLRDQMSLLSRKFKTKRQAVQEREFGLTDDTFIIDPPCGDIWPNSEVEITVAFKPGDATQYSRTIYCDVTGREARLPLKLRGEGVGPQLQFSYKNLSMGRIFVGSSHIYEVVLSNVGDIEAPFKLEAPGTLMGSCFDISPATGTVQPGGHQAIRLAFRSVHLGQISEDLSLLVTGAPDGEIQSVAFDGEVIGPTFRFSVAEVDFGTVAYGFATERVFELINTSLVPMTYTLHFPDDDEFQHDFEIETVAGTIPPNERVLVKVDLVPSMLTIYDTYISVDVEGVGKNLLTVPIVAESIAPEVRLANPLLDFGRCFLNRQVPHKLQLVNDGNLPAKFSVLPFETDMGAECDVDTKQGLIPAQSVVDVNVLLTPDRIGAIEVRGLVEIAGIPDYPLELRCGAIGEGPVMSVAPVALDWDQQPVLVHADKQLLLTNESEIPAVFNCSLKKKDKSVFKCEPATGTMQPGEAVIVTVTATLDDTIGFSDMLSILVEDGTPLHIPLKAKGAGTTIHCQDDLNLVDFGQQFSKDETSKKFTLVNGGRRTQEVTFKLDAPPPVVSGHQTVMRGGSYEAKRTNACPNPPLPDRSFFGVSPESARLAPGESVEIEIAGYSSMPRHVEETFLCMGSLILAEDHKTRPRVLFSSKVQAQFINPLLDISTRGLSFSANQSIEGGLAEQMQEVKLVNVTPLPLTLTLDCLSEGHFELVTDAQAQLASGESMVAMIKYNPLATVESLSRIDTGLLKISYAEHPQTDKVGLEARVFHPNLMFSSESMAFGCVPNGHRIVRNMEITNPSLMPVEYSWEFSEKQNLGKDVEQIFDIVPMKSVLQPDESANTRFYFHGHPNSAHSTMAQCFVTDGPSYVIPLTGSASVQTFYVSETELDFGEVAYEGTAELGTDIVNAGLVDVEFSILDCPGRVQIMPPTGTVSAKGAISLSVAICPGTPEAFDEVALLQVGHLDPIPIRLIGKGVYPTVGLSLPEATVGTDVLASTIPKLTKKTSKLPSSTHILDFGSIIRGRGGDQEVKITNTFSSPVTIKVLRKKLTGEYLKAFTVEPDVIRDLPPGASSTVKVGFMSAGTSRMEFPLGRFERNLPLQVLGGPRINVALAADVCEPQLELSLLKAQFGSVKVGDCKVIVVRLTNPTSVNVKWNCSRKFNELPGGTSLAAQQAHAKKRTMNACFVVSPEGGVIEPGSSMHVSVRFTPVEAATSNAVIPFRVSESSEKFEVKCRGTGNDCIMEFVSELNMGPVLPNGGNDERTITVKNDSNFDVEFFSREYDSQYLEEESVLASLTEYDQDDTLLLPPRLPNAGLPRELMGPTGKTAPPTPAEVADADGAVGEDLSEEEVAAAAAAAAAADAASEAQVGEVVDGSPVQAAIDRYLGEDVRREKYKRDHGGFNAVIHGAPFSGKKTQAAEWAKHYSSLVLSVDTIIEAAMNNKTNWGEQARTVCYDAEVERRAEAEELKAAKEKKDKKDAKADAECEEVEVAAVPIEGENGLPPATALEKELLYEIINERLCEGDTLDGVIFTGVMSKYGSILDVLSAVLRGLNHREHLYFIELDTESSLCVDRINSRWKEIENKTDYGAEVNKLLELTEPEYDALSEEKKAEFNEARAKLKAEMRVLRREKLAMDAKMRQEELAREEEEKKGKKGKGGGGKDNRSSKLMKGGAATPSADEDAEPHFEQEGDSITLLSLVPQEVKASEPEEDAVPDDCSVVESSDVELSWTGTQVAMLEAYNSSLDHTKRFVACWDRTLCGPTSSYTAPVEEEPADAKDTKGKKVQKPKTPTAKGQKLEDESDELEELVPEVVPEDCMDVKRVPSDGDIDATTAILYTLGVVSQADVMAALGLSGEQESVPEPIEYLLVQRPEMRAHYDASTAFVFFDPEIMKQAVAAAAARKAAEAEAEALAAAHPAKGKKSAKGKKDVPERKKSAGKSRSKSAKKRAGSASSEGAVEEPAAFKVNDVIKAPRWVVPANSEITLHVRFRSATCGIYDQTFSFETVGSKRVFEVHARGTCEYPHVHAKSLTIAVPVDDTIVLKSAGVANQDGSVDTDMLERTLPFGPVLVGMPRDNYKEEDGVDREPFKQHVARLLLKNPSDAPIQITAGLESDASFVCFTTEPQEFMIPAGEEFHLRVWAYPKETIPYQDRLILCVKDNPQPVIYKVSVQGVKPELTFSDNSMVFDRLLLRRKATESIKIKNNCPLPVKWNLNGLDLLGDDFEAPITTGVIQGNGEYEMVVHFRASRPVNIKKQFKIEYSDEKDVIGLIGNATINVLAEAYDLSLSLVFPKNTEQSLLDFEKLRAHDDKQLICTLKNRGKYEVKYRFTIDKAALKKIPGATPDMLTVVPSSQDLKPSDRPLQVRVTLRPGCEMILDAVPLLRCEIIDPNLDETIARIPVAVSAQSVFSRYSVTPVRGLNFGPHEYPWTVSAGRLKVAPREFILKNTGTHVFRYNILKTPKVIKSSSDAPRAADLLLNNMKSLGPGLSAAKRLSTMPGGSTPAPSESGGGGGGGGGGSGGGARSKAANDAKFQIGCFTVSRGGGELQPGCSEKISVEVTDTQDVGRYEQQLYIDVEQRDEGDVPHGLEYNLMIEACKPAIVTDDFYAIFCEHAITHRLDSPPQEPTFAVDTQQFIFGHVPLGAKQTARVRILNPTKIECEVNAFMKPKATKLRSKGPPAEPAFTVEPAHLVIPAHEHAVVTVTFSPTACHPYLSDFVCELDKCHDSKSYPPGSVGNRVQFEIGGDGALPRVTLVKPSEVTALGANLLQFRKTLVNKERQHEVEVRNDGLLPARVFLEIVAVPDGREQSRSGSRPPPAEGRPGSGKRPLTRSGRPKSSRHSKDPVKDHTLLPAEPSLPGTQTDGTFAIVGDGLPVTVQPGESRKLIVSFCPTSDQVYNANLQLTTFDNLYETQMIEVAGEGFNAENSLEGLDGDNMVLAFGDTPLSIPKSKAFQLMNHSTETMRYAFAKHKDVRFVPSTGHMLPGSSHMITSTFQPTAPCAYDNKPELECIMTKVSLPDQDPDAEVWNDSRRETRWVVNEGVDGRLVRTELSEPVQEPAITHIANASNVTLGLSGVSDYSKFEIKAVAEETPQDLKEVSFKETLMFQTRLYKYKLVNTGVVAFGYSWDIAEDAMDIDNHDTHYTPFMVEPASGRVDAGQSIEITARFAPLDAGEFAALLKCDIENVDPALTTPSIDLYGTSKRPFCHIELPPSDYVSSGRRDKRMKGPSGLPGQLDPSTRVFEMISCGVGTVTKGRFFITNPVDIDYNFAWRCQLSGNHDELPTVKKDSVEIGPFKCSTPRATLQSGKKIEVLFEFNPHALKIYESFWRFTIPEHGIDIPFLVVGRALEPRITLDKNVLSMMPLLVGQTVKGQVVLRNDEDRTFSFNFRKDVLENVNRAATVKVTPSSGSILPGEETTVTVLFSPEMVQPYNFQLYCDVKKKPSPLVINVRCLTYSVQADLVSNDTGEKQDTAETSIVNFKSIPVFDVVKRSYTLFNNGDHPFDFDWRVHQRKTAGKVLSIKPPRGSVDAGGRTNCEIIFSQLEETPVSIVNVPVTCSVSNGPTYRFDVTGAARLPQLHWNFGKLNFGKVFIYQPGMQKPTRVLEIANEDVEQVSLQAIIPSSDVFEIDFTDTTIQPGQVLQIPIKFTPTDAQSYKTDVTFSINGRSTQTISISGVGTTLRLMVNKLPQRILDFGSLVVGDVAERTVDVCNRSAIPVEFAAMGNLANLDALNVHLSPMNVMRLKPGETTALTFVFAPRERLPPFAEKINAECAGQITALMEVRGACQGVQLEMDNDQLAFGSVNVHSRSVKRVLLSNSGDIGAKFNWKIPKEAQKWFTLAPEKGYLSPGLEVIMLVTFHPTKTMQDCRFEGIKCEVEGGASLSLDLVGTASPQKAASDQLSFSQSVRTSETKTIKLENKTAHPYDISPIMEHEYFTGPSSIAVEPGQTKLYEVTYTPLSMNQGQGVSRSHSKDDAHTGSLFFALPDGNTLMYSLVGHAGAPKAQGGCPILRDVPCKVPYTEALPVTNWLGKPQRFKMFIKLVKPSSLDNSTKIEGLDYIDVPGHSTRDYKLNFYAFREGTTQCEIHLKNETTGEYMFYEVTFKATAAGVLDTIPLNTCVRSVTRHTVDIANPLTVPVEVQMTCAYLPEPGQKASGSLQCGDIHGPIKIKLPSASKASGPAIGKYTFDFLPLIEGKRKARMTLSCAELGTFQYDLVLNATPHGPLPLETFSACLGETITHNFTFTNYSTQRGDYQITIDNPAFSAPSSIATAPSGKPKEESFEVTYEPSTLGSVKAMMKITSKVGGTYLCPLFGECALPRPSGPYVMKAGYSTKIPFKNVFNEQTDFTYSIDNSSFSLLKQKDTSKPKEEHNVVVKYLDESKEGVVRSARLVVTVASGPHTGTKWIFYVSGVPV